MGHTIDKTTPKITIISFKNCKTGQKQAAGKNYKTMGRNDKKKCEQKYDKIYQVTFLYN